MNRTHISPILALTIGAAATTLALTIDPRSTLIGILIGLAILTPSIIYIYLRIRRSS